MTFRDALEREISLQGISVAEVADKSRVSKGTIYNILNGTTEDARIRAATRRAIARGCDRDIEVLPDGGVVFVDPKDVQVAHHSDALHLTLVPFCAFQSQSHVAEPFDWLHQQEELGKLIGLKTVDRVFQRREDFLELRVVNQSDSEVVGLTFTLHVVFDNGVVGDISCRVLETLTVGQVLKRTIFLLGGPGYHLTFPEAEFTDENSQSWQISSVPTYRFEGDPA